MYIFINKHYQTKKYCLLPKDFLLLETTCRKLCLLKARSAKGRDAPHLGSHMKAPNMLVWGIRPQFCTDQSPTWTSWDRSATEP